jgi:hypothetical protein
MDAVRKREAEAAKIERALSTTPSAITTRAS